MITGKKVAFDRKLGWLVLRVIVCIIAQLLVGCEPRGISVSDEKIPEIISVTNAPELQSYVLEFSKLKESSATHISIMEQPEPLVPANRSLIEGKIIWADHNTNCSSWLILSCKGRNWMEQQKVYVYSEKTTELQELTAFAGKVLWQPYLLSDEDCTNSFILTEVTTEHYRPWDDAVWEFDFRSNELKRLTDGHNTLLAPNRSMVLFSKTDRNGFHSLYLMNIQDRQTEFVMSLWESDPGSGPGWECRWSGDSKIIDIKGNCGGFSRAGQRKYTELNLIYLIKDKKMYSVEHP